MTYAPRSTAAWTSTSTTRESRRSPPPSRTCCSQAQTATRVVADLNAAISKTPGNANILLARLVDVGVLYRVRKRQYEYTAPRFRDFLLRRGDDANQVSLFGHSR